MSTEDRRWAGAGWGRRMVRLALAAALVSLASQVHAAAFSMVELATLSEGTSTVVRGPNTAGAAVGAGRLVRDGQMAALRQGLLFEPGATVVVPGLPNSGFTTVFGLNDVGALVGSVNMPEGVRGFAGSRSGAVRELPPLVGDAASMAFAVSNNGVAVGFSSGPGGQRAVAWNGGSAAALAAPPGAQSRALSVNARGDIVGDVTTGTQRRAVLWHIGAAVQELGLLPGFSTSEAAHVNARGDIVGFSATTDGARRATLWRAEVGAPVNLGTLPNHTLSQALGSNDAGEVVGFSGDAHGMRAVMWSQAGGLQDLNTLVPPSHFVLTRAVGINNTGMIIAVGFEPPAGEHDHDHAHEHELPTRVFLLTRAGG